MPVRINMRENGPEGAIEGQPLGRLTIVDEDGVEIGTFDLLAWGSTGHAESLARFGATEPERLPWWERRVPFEWTVFLYYAVGVASGAALATHSFSHALEDAVLAGASVALLYWLLSLLRRR